MKIKAAVLSSTGKQAPYAQSQPLTIQELELDRPGDGEGLVRIRAAGLCHSDLSTINGNRPRPTPMALSFRDNTGCTQTDSRYIITSVCRPLPITRWSRAIRA